LRDENSRREMESALDKPTDQVTFWSHANSNSFKTSKRNKAEAKWKKWGRWRGAVDQFLTIAPTIGTTLVPATSPNTITIIRRSETSQFPQRPREEEQRERNVQQTVSEFLRTECLLNLETDGIKQ
jgi:hypothetical protein